MSLFRIWRSNRYLTFIFLIVLGFVAVAPMVFASGDSTQDSSGSHGFVPTLLWIAVILLAAKFSSLVEKIGQPSVLGELVIGIILGNLAILGIHIFDPIKSDLFIPFLTSPAR